jgi:N-acetylmuramoyl-L-alanine amidase
MIIVVDAGHGGGDKGGTSLGTPESLLVLPYATALSTVLRDAGHTVLLTRTQDVFLTLGERARLANEAMADTFVSFHANASDNPSASGPWTLYAQGSTKGFEIATAVQGTLARVLRGNPRKVYPDASPYVDNRRLAVLRQTKMPAILIELGFMTNQLDLERITQAQIRMRACAALACTLAGLQL